MKWMSRGVAIAFLAVGVILLIVGINAWQSAGSGVSEALTGAPTNKALWLVVGGVILLILGGVGTFHKVQKNAVS